MTLSGATTKPTRSRPLRIVAKPLFAKVAHAYQRRAIKFLLMHGAAALLLDPGMGKTAVVLKAFDALLKAKTAKRALVIAPLRVCQLVWPQEPGEWEDLKHLRVGLLHGKHKEEVLANADQYDILVINPEGLEWLINGGKGKHFNRRRWQSFGFDTLVIDELTKFKKTSGVRFKALKQVLETFARRWGLTGTPAPNGLLDLFGQMYVLDLGNALGRFITHYRMQYFRAVDPQGWKWVLQKGAEERIYERIKPLAMRASAEDHLELPEIVPLKVMVELPPAARKLYDTLEDDLLAKLDDRIVTAANAAAMSTKCRQIANGALYVDDDVASLVAGKRRTVMEVHEAKLDAVSELHESLNGAPLLLGYEFNHDLDRLLKRFPKTPYIGAGIGDKEAKRVEAAWNAGDLDLMFGHPASMGHGLNMQKSNAQHVGLFSSMWDLELYLQFIRRVRRQGNKAKRCFVHHFLAVDTIDIVAYNVQRGKDKRQNALLEALQERRR